jgi:guanylate kinase
MKTVHQVVPWHRWPSGDSRTVAVLEATPTELEEWFSLDFLEETDDLDSFRFAAIADPQIGQIWLSRHLGCADPGTEVLVDSVVDIADALQAVGRQLGPRAALTTWVANQTSPHVDSPALAPVVIVLHGPAGVGKDSVIDELRRRTGIHRPVSSTTRSPRKGEVDGVDYHFLPRTEFERRIAAGDFIEWANVYQDLKGVEREEIERPLAEGRDMIIRTDVQGARTWRDQMAGAIFVFLMAEDREALRARLIGRDSEDGESLAARMAELEEELADIPNNDHLVINHHRQLQRAVNEIVAIMDAARTDTTRLAPRLK